MEEVAIREEAAIRKRRKETDNFEKQKKEEEEKYQKRKKEDDEYWASLMAEESDTDDNEDSVYFCVACAVVDTKEGCFVRDRLEWTRQLENNVVNVDGNSMMRDIIVNELRENGLVRPNYNLTCNADV